MNTLPPSSTALELSIEAACRSIDALPVDVIADVTRPELAPEWALPYLAWEVSVDRWSEAWPLTTKLQVIRDSFYVHKHKGTIASLRRVVEPFGYLLDVIEWHEMVPPARRGTFQLVIGVNNEGITDETYAELVRLIDEARPLSRHVTGLQISLVGQGAAYMGAAAFLGDELTVYPPQQRDIEVVMQPGAIGALHIIDTLTVKQL